MNKKDIPATVIISPSSLPSSVKPFQGWGTSLCWWANRIGYSDALAQKAAGLFFGENGLRLNIMRYNIGGGDDPSHDHIMRTDSAVPGWLRFDEKGNSFVYDYSADKNQLNVLKRSAEAAGENAIVEVFSNSPPYFMTVSGCSSGGTDPSADNLRPEYYASFAGYLVHVTEYIQTTLGIKVTSLSPMNEPNTSYWNAYSGKQEGCHFDPGESQSKIIENTYDLLKKHGLEQIIVSASDETDTGKQIDSYHRYTDEAKVKIGRINTHTYGTDRIDELGKLASEDGFDLWMSEVDGDGISGTDAGEMGSALWLGGKIISDLNALMPSAWVMWQVIDRHISKSGWNGRRDNGMVNLNRGFWGTAVCDHDKEEIILTQKYYGMGQFTRYIAPGSLIIRCGSDTLAAYSRDKKELTVVALNTDAKEMKKFFDLSEFSQIGDTVKVIRTSGSITDGEHWAALEDLHTEKDGFCAMLKSNSITTFIAEGVEL